MTWAVTLDFHNTIASCDEWFRLEVYDLIPAFLDWRQRTSGLDVDPDAARQGKAYYRELRQQVMSSGVEMDAAASVLEVMQMLRLDVSPEEVEEALVSIFNPTLAGTSSVPGIVDSVKALRAAEIRLAVVSSAAYHSFLEWTLEKFGIADCFEAILTSASTGHYKSTPKIYSAALDTLKVPADFCIHIGDSEQFDVRPAAAVGINTVLYSQNGHMEFVESMADLQLSSLHGLPAALRNRFGLPVEI